MTKLYTRNGDHGKTAGKKIATNTYETVTKAHPLIQLFGAIDELVAYLGAKLQYACAIARRLENEIYVYINKMTIPVYASWLNRLSTYLYTYAHYIDTQTNTTFLN